MKEGVFKKRLKQAEDSLKDAEMLQAEGLGNSLVLAKLYHTMIYGVLGLFGLEDIGNLSHAELLERFEREYVSRGIFSTEHLQALRLAYNLTHSCDCVDRKEPQDRDLKYLFPVVKDFYRVLSSID
ncbi:MAG: hypothetical protein D6710_10525 [Nitrospirae bacterium]|nr:MAG: hypothetical protein D6710_10525 [Nitrospirota bacterium]